MPRKQTSSLSHPLEDKAWFRFLKVVYIAAWVVGALVLTILAASGEADDVVGIIRCQSLAPLCCLL